MSIEGHFHQVALDLRQIRSRKRVDLSNLGFAIIVVETLHTSTANRSVVLVLFELPVSPSCAISSFALVQDLVDFPDTGICVVASAELGDH